jgi:hypothetical protein
MPSFSFSARCFAVTSHTFTVFFICTVVAPLLYRFPAVCAAATGYEAAADGQQLQVGDHVKLSRDFQKHGTAAGCAHASSNHTLCFTLLQAALCAPVTSDA